MLIFIAVQVGLAIYIYSSEDNPENIDQSHAPIQIISIIIAIVFLIIIMMFYNENIELACLIIIISLLMSCTTLYYLRHLDKDYVEMNTIRSSAAQPATTFITNSMKSSFQQEKQMKNDLVNTNANRYNALQIKQL
jgi:amino acid transporter